MTIMVLWDKRLFYDRGLPVAYRPVVGGEIDRQEQARQWLLQVDAAEEEEWASEHGEEPDHLEGERAELVKDGESDNDGFRLDGDPDYVIYFVNPEGHSP